MGFGRKKPTVGKGIEQKDVAMLATQALDKARSARVSLALSLIFTTGVLMNRWSNKAIQALLASMVGIDLPRGKKDITADFEAAWYRNMKNEPAIPCRVIKAAIIDGAISTDGVVTKAELKRELRVVGWTAPLRLPEGHNGKNMHDALERDTRIVSNSNGKPDVRSRAIAPAGSRVDVVLEFPSTLTPDKVMAAVKAAGETIGIGDWRPDKGGEFGRFEVVVLNQDMDKHIARIMRECASPEQQYEIPEVMLRAWGNTADTGIKSDAARKAKAVLDQVTEQASGHQAVVEPPKRSRKKAA
jgi:hypothetical protein